MGWTPDNGCIDLNNANITGGPTFFGDSFQWIRCSYCPESFGDSRPGSLIPPGGEHGGDCWTPNVVQWQASDFNETNDYHVKKLNLTVDNLDKTERLLIVQGSYDITTAFGAMQDLTLTSDRNHSRYIYVQGMAHTEDAWSYAVVPRGVKPIIDQVFPPPSSWVNYSLATPCEC